MTNAPKIITSRRRLLLGAGAGAVALAAPSVWSPSHAAGKRIVVRDDGGIYTKAYGAVYYRPFTDATGIEVVGVQANAEPVAQIKTMVDTKSYTWDMAKISWPAIQLLTTGGKVEQMLTSGEVDMLPTWVSRAQSAQAAGAPVEIVWNQGVWGADNWSILAGTPNADACREFIKFASDPKRQAALVEYFPAGLTQPEAFNYVKPEVAKNCPTYPDNIKAGLK